MHAILANVGTGGDVYPYVGLGARLRARGHRVTLASNEPFRALAKAHGLEFRPIVSEAETEDFLNHPDLWHPVRGASFLARWGVRLIPGQYAALADLAREPDSALVTSPAIFGARLVQEQLGRPLASVILQPWLLQSVHMPPILPLLPLPCWAPRPVGHLYWRLVDVIGDLLIGPTLNRLRAPLGLPPVRRVFCWWLSPQRVIGLFPAWFGPPQPDWPAQVRLANFPHFDGCAPELPADVAEFCAAGEPAVAFTFGTGMRHGAALFRAATEACRLLGVRGLLLTRHRQQLPQQLPPYVRHCPFAPFRELLPYCAALVHHGGVGTVGRALAAGTPQLVLPHAYDQMDNAVRVRRLGAGDWLRARHFTGSGLARALRELLAAPARAQCQAVARSDTGDGLEAAADQIEELARECSMSRALTHSRRQRAERGGSGIGNSLGAVPLAAAIGGS